MKPTLFLITLTFDKANGKPATKRDVARLDEDFLNESADIVHGCNYAVHSTTWKKPEVVEGSLVVEVEVELEPYEKTTPDALAYAVESEVGCFAPEWLEVACVEVTPA